VFKIPAAQRNMGEAGLTDERQLLFERDSVIEGRADGNQQNALLSVTPKTVALIVSGSAMIMVGLCAGGRTN